MLTEKLQNQIKNANGRRRSRLVTEREIAEMEKQIANAGDGVHTIRVYSFNGFLPNAYKYRAEISYLEATRQDDGSFQIVASTCDAKRSHGSGSLVTINGRAI